MVLISFVVLAGRGGRGSVLLMVIGVDLGVSFWKLSLEGGVCSVNFKDILNLRLFVF